MLLFPFEVKWFLINKKFPKNKYKAMVLVEEREREMEKKEILLFSGQIMTFTQKFMFFSRKSFTLSYGISPKKEKIKWETSNTDAASFCIYHTFLWW